MSSTLVALIFALLMIPGVLAVLVPMLPGIPYLFVVALLYGVIDGFTRLTGPDLAILGGITILSFIVDQLAGMIGAKYGGAKGKSLLYGFIGIIIGTIIFPFFGGLIGLFLGVLIGELQRRRTSEQAMRAATASVMGSFTGIIINFLLALTFFILFLVFTL